MKRFILVLIVLLAALMIFNFTQINTADLAWEKNKVAYLNLVGNFLIMTSPLAYLPPLRQRSQIRYEKGLFLAKEGKTRKCRPSSISFRKGSA